jgi:hypothetical protein
MIAIQNPYSKDIRAVYCHWDGYLEHNGAILQKHYSNSPKVNNLIALGDLSSLRPEIGVQHAFSSLDVPKQEQEAYDKEHGNSCTFYGRDRGEKDVGFKVFPTLAKACDHYTWSEYFYCFKYSKADDYQSGEWHYKKAGDRWKKLAPAIKKLDPKKCAE